MPHGHAALLPASPLSLLLLVACGAAAEHPVQTAVRDSAGVTIVENPGDTSAVPQWAVAEPEVLIGGRPEDPGYDFNLVRWAGLLSDGRLLVLDGSSAELREYDAGGRHLRTLARSGAGPGEFRRPYSPWLLPGDTLEVLDSGNRRLSRFGPDGTFLTSEPLQSRLDARVFVSPFGRLADGRLLVQVFTVEDLNNRLGERGWDTWGLAATNAEGSLDTLTTIGASYGYVREASEGDAVFLTRTPIPFGPRGHYRAAGGRLYSAVSSAMVFDEWDVDGTLRRSIRVAWPSRPVGEADREAWREQQLEGLARWRAAPPRMREQEQRRIDESPFAEVYPAFSAFNVGTTGELWIELARRPGDEVRQYLVLDPEGRTAGRLALPPRVRPLQFGPDRIVAVVRDGDDVEHIAVYPVLRPGSELPAG